MSKITLKKQRAGCRFRLYPACEASIWLCGAMGVKCLAPYFVAGLKKFFDLEVEILE